MHELSLKNTRLDERYDVQMLLGRGSYAEIYVARDTRAVPQSPHSLVVIKALNVFMQNDLDADLERTLVENFQNEAIALDRVRHPNVISRLGHGTARDLRGTVFHYLVLEYLPGGDLAKACREKSLSFDKALFYLEQVCAGLAHAHQKGIIHRDIKPQNLLLTEDRQTVKIADFGVARLSQSDSPITRVGTNMFAPPEHSPMLAGTTGTPTTMELTPAADIYSLAKSAYVLITCESPRFFTNQPITELPFDQRQKPWAGELVRILNKATQNNTADRYQSVSEFWQELSALQILSTDKEDATQIAAARQPHSVPQPHVSKGYTPMAPQRPRFNTTRDLKVDPSKLPIHQKSPLVVKLNTGATNQPSLPAAEPPIVASAGKHHTEAVESKRNFSAVRKFAIFLLFIGLFAGLLYGTHSYLRGRGIFPDLGVSLSNQTATANGDVYLRSTPNTNNPPIGVVTKDSRLKIVGSAENWYEVDIIEQGDPSAPADYAKRGWVSGKYVDLQNN